MKKQFLLPMLVFISSICLSNNIQVNNVSLTGQNTTSDYSMVKFDISWENSWRTSTLESNWDAAWIFVKFRKRTSLAWQQATLNTTGSVAPAGSVITPALDGKGAFIYRSANGTGNVSWINAQLRWNYGVNGLLDHDSVEVCVYAIEMVYIPQGAFYAGDGSSTLTNGQFEAGISGNPYLVTSENLIILGGTAPSNLGNHSANVQSRADDFNSMTTKNLLASFPKGFNAFYIMKYEISQAQYAAFLNSLTWAQQTSRAAGTPASATGTPALSIQNRNGLVVQTPGVILTSTAVYGCNLDGDALYNETNDGQNNACNFLNHRDVSAYLDWSCLRPMTELEYEKACRGVNVQPVADEYAWGGNLITGATGISNAGLGNEAASNSGANCAYNNAVGVSGPMRSGCFALLTNRQNSGGSYYGVMEMTGNVAELTVSVFNLEGRGFTGLHGDGNLDIDGEANTNSWPNSLSAPGIIYKGGDWNQGSSLLRISDRTNSSTYFNAFRANNTGGRGVRTAP